MRDRFFDASGGCEAANGRHKLSATIASPIPIRGDPDRSIGIVSLGRWRACEIEPAGVGLRIFANPVVSIQRWTTSGDRAGGPGRHFENLESLRWVMCSTLLSRQVEQALRFAALSHQGQTRRGGNTPYFAHVVAVAIILDRAQFEEDVVIAGLLHDVVEDTPVTLAEVAVRFGESVAEIVRHCSEIKTDDLGVTRPWIDRKRDHIVALAEAPLTARAVVLADKLHNLVSIELDLHRGRPVWSLFHAERDQVLWYYRTMIERCGADDSRLVQLAEACREVLRRVEGAG
jgi:guanosine-3',5'-bis(diphosphate) 3'-pyrophosphohydrolase